jgi:hypothetical protein
MARTPVDRLFSICGWVSRFGKLFGYWFWSRGASPSRFLLNRSILMVLRHELPDEHSGLHEYPFSAPPHVSFIQNQHWDNIFALSSYIKV